MIKLLIKLAIVGLLANATWRVGSVYASHYKFLDSVEQTAQYRGRQSDQQLRERIFQLASEFDIPLDGGALTVRRENNHTIVEASYERSLELLPGFTYPWSFTIHVDRLVLESLK